MAGAGTGVTYPRVTGRRPGCAGWGALFTVMAVSTAAAALLAHGRPVLVAGGEFTAAGGAQAWRIATWDGAAWATLGTGMTWRVQSFEVYEGDLIAGGDFLTSGGVATNGVGRWNGTSWASVGAGVFNPVYDDTVRALTVYNGTLVVGGEFTNTHTGVYANRIAQWSELAGWSPLSSGMSDTVRALTTFQGRLIAGGIFRYAGDVLVNGIAQWDGDGWSDLDGGVSEFSYVYAFCTHKDVLFVGGQFEMAGTLPVRLAAQWNGSAWAAVGAGLDGTAILALTVYDDVVIAGGLFAGVSGADTANVAVWDGVVWSALAGGGTNDRVYALSVYSGDVIAGGWFSTAGGAPANHIARWNGSSWSAVSEGANANIYSLIVYDSPV